MARSIEPYRDQELPNQFQRWIETLRLRVGTIPCWSYIDGSPEGVINGQKGDWSYDTTANVYYIKDTDTGNTGWSLIAGGGGGNVTKVGTPVDNQIGVWTGDGTLEGDDNLIWTGAILGVDGILRPLTDATHSLGGINNRWHRFFLNDFMRISDTNPTIQFHQSNAGVDQKFWLERANGEAYEKLIVSDNLVETTIWMSVQRSGTGASIQVDTIDFTAVDDFTINSDLAITGDIGFYNTAPAAKPTVTGSRAGNAALASLLTGLAGLGLIIDSSTA